MAQSSGATSQFLITSPSHTAHCNSSCCTQRTLQTLHLLASSITTSNTIPRKSDEIPTTSGKLIREVNLWPAITPQHILFSSQKRLWKVFWTPTSTRFGTVLDPGHPTPATPWRKSLTTKNRPGLPTKTTAGIHPSSTITARTAQPRQLPRGAKALRTIGEKAGGAKTTSHSTATLAAHRGTSSVHSLTAKITGTVIHCRLFTIFSTFCVNICTLIEYF